MYCPPLLLFGSPGWVEILVVLLIILLLFGAKRLPEMMGSFGKGIKEFKKGVKDIGRELESDEEEKRESRSAPPAPGDPERRERDKQPDGEGS